MKYLETLIWPPVAQLPVELRYVNPDYVATPIALGTHARMAGRDERNRLCYAAWWIRSSTGRVPAYKVRAERARRTARRIKWAA